MKPLGTRVTRVAGLLLGLSLATAVVLDSRMPRGTGTLGADVIVSAAPTGELGVDPTGPFLSTTNLRPGPESGAAAGRIEVFNWSAVPLDVHVGVEPSDVGLDELLWVSVRAGERSLYRGPLGGLRGWSDLSLRLPSNQRAEVAVRTWLPPSAEGGWSGRVEKVYLRFLSKPVTP